MPYIATFDQDATEEMSIVMGRINSDVIQKAARRINDKGVVFLVDVQKIFEDDR